MLEVQLLRSVTQLRQIGESWNRLWERSDSTSPLTCNEPLAIWLEYFANGREVRIITVWEGKKLVAALPLLVGKKKGMKVAELPNNEWSFSGDLLVDSGYESSAVNKALVQGMNQIETLVVWLDWIRIDQPKWQNLTGQLKLQQQSSFAKERFQVAEIRTPESFEVYAAERSKNHRKKMKRALRQLSELGQVTLEDYDSCRLEQQLEEAFLIEHRGWKGENGSSIKTDSHIESYFCELALSLDRAGHFALQFLRVGGRAVAFDFGYLAKGVRGSQKISFDAEFAKSSPGQLLVGQQIKWAAEDGGNKVSTFDTIGPTTEAIGKWTSDGYGIGRIFLSNQRWTSRITVGAISQLSHIMTKVRSPTHSC